MTNVDQFESVFRSAAKEVYHRHEIPLRDAMVVTDLPAEEAEAFAARVRTYLGAIGDIRLMVASGDAYRGTGELLDRVENAAPHLVCAYRNLHSTDYERPHSLGEHLDVLTQIASAPVLVLPNPRVEAIDHDAWSKAGTRRVMAVTDHLRGDNRLVDWALRFTDPSGALWLGHVEDEAVFERYCDVVSKIPAIDTDQFRELVHAQLLKEPRDYIESCKAALAEENIRIDVAPAIALGHHLSDYKRLVAEHDVGLLVLNTRDEDQLAMHGIAYELAVELRQTPLLLL